MFRKVKITTVLASLPWQPVYFRIGFEIILIPLKPLPEFKSLYLPTSRDAVWDPLALLAIPTPRLKTKGDRAFAVRAPTLWINLPEEIKLAESLTCFISLLKTHIYKNSSLFLLKSAKQIKLLFLLIHR